MYRYLIIKLDTAEITSGKSHTGISTVYVVPGWLKLIVVSINVY